MNHGNNPNDDINLDLSLWIDSREEDPMEQQGPLMELLTSENNNVQPSPPRDPFDLTLALLPIPPVENNSLPGLLSPSPQLNQVFPSMQREALETSSTRLTLGRSPVENVSLEALFNTPSTQLGQPPVENSSLPALSLHQQFYHQPFPPIQPAGFGALDTTPNIRPIPVENSSVAPFLLYPPMQPGALQTPSIRPRLGRPPAENQGRRYSSSDALRARPKGNINLNDEEIVPAYPWATTKPAVVHNLRYLTSNNINMIFGKIYCKPCNKTITLEYNLREKFRELSRYIDEKEEGMRHRAPEIWMNPQLTSCTSCQSVMKPLLSANMKDINWLFLFLGQMLGCCNLNQLRYFCDKTKQHQTGSKGHVLYQTYLSIYKQLKSD